MRLGSSSSWELGVRMGSNFDVVATREWGKGCEYSSWSSLCRKTVEEGDSNFECLRFAVSV